MVRSPVTFSLPSPAASTFFDVKVMVGYFCASRKRGLRRSLSRISTRVSMEAASMVAWIEAFEGLAGSYCTVPLTLVNAPRTVETPRWRTENCADEWGGSSCQASCAAADRVSSRVMARAERVRDMNSRSPEVDSQGPLQFNKLGVSLEAAPSSARRDSRGRLSAHELVSGICRLRDQGTWLCSRPRGVVWRARFPADSSCRHGCSWSSARRHLCAPEIARTARLRQS